MSSKQLAHFLWVEKYRPQSIKDTILPAKLKKYFLGLVEKKEIPNLLLASNSPGTGKCLEKSQEIEIEIDETTYQENRELFNN